MSKAHYYVFYVYCHNKTDDRDDDVVKVRATTSTKAKEKARELRDSFQFQIGSAYRVKDFRVRFPDWYDLLKDLRV
jgi:hypothetical protein